MSSYQRAEVHEQRVETAPPHEEKEHRSILGKIKDKVLGKDEDECKSACKTCTVDTKCEEHKVAFAEADTHERQAHALRKEGVEALAKTQKEFSEAERAQQAARLASEHANMKTAQALNNQERGQTMLAEAGAQMIEAGAKLQQEATNVQVGQVPFNEHRQGEIQQTTCVSAAGQEAAQRAHEQATFRNVQYSEAH